jgi:sugar phosphate isomerase/epimerase
MDFSFQLYSARNFPPISAIFEELARLGYTEVEGFGGLYNDLDELAGALKRSGLSMPTGHFGLDLLKDTDKALHIAEALGMVTLFCPAIPQAERSQAEEGWLRLAETLQTLDETYRARGFQFGWHNHAFEFAALPSGRLPMDIILEGAPGLDWEMDVAWVVRGNQDPLAWIERHGQRITAAHVKDIAPQGEALDEDGWADVGYGTLDWPTIFGALKAKTRASVFVMEHDNPSDALRFAERSIATARSW